MKTANIKGMVIKSVLGATAMGLMLFAGTAKAQAQQFAVGVQYGTPYAAGYYGGHRDFDRDRDFYRDRERREAFERQQAFLRRQEIERREAFARHEAWEHGQRPYGWYR